MTDIEATKILTILKAAYPKDYPYNMTVDEAKVTAIVWAEQFRDIPGDIVELAVKQLISTEERCFSIAKVKKQIGSLYWEAKSKLEQDDMHSQMIGCNGLDENTQAYYERIKRITGDYKYSRAIELPISHIVGKEEMLMLCGKIK